MIMRRFTVEDLYACWSYHEERLIDILNGDYDLNEAREDLDSLVGSKFDKREPNPEADSTSDKQKR